MFDLLPFVGFHLYWFESVLMFWKSHQPSRSEIGIRHDAVTGFPGFKSGEGLVDLAHLFSMSSAMRATSDG
jgi:hypothetical protein